MISHSKFSNRKCWKMDQLSLQIFKMFLKKIKDKCNIIYGVHATFKHITSPNITEQD